MRRLMVRSVVALAACVCLAPAAWAQYGVPANTQNQPSVFRSQGTAQPIRPAANRYASPPSAPLAMPAYQQTWPTAQQPQGQRFGQPAPQPAGTAPRYPVPSAYSQIGVQRAIHTQPVGITPPQYRQQGAYLSRTPPGYPGQVVQAGYKAPVATAARSNVAPIYPHGSDSEFVGAGMEQNLLKARVSTPPGEVLPGANVYQQQPGKSPPSAATRSRGWAGRLRVLFPF